MRKRCSFLIIKTFWQYRSLVHDKDAISNHWGLLINDTRTTGSHLGKQDKISSIPQRTRE